jgi:hypothetical protein
VSICKLIDANCLRFSETIAPLKPRWHQRLATGGADRWPATGS